MKYLENFNQKFSQAVNYGNPTDEFWDFIDRMEWPKYASRSWSLPQSRYKEGDPTEVESMLNNIAPYHSSGELKEYEMIYENLHAVLTKKLKDAWLGNPGINVSDDGFHYLCGSIIGMGKKFTGSVLNDNTFNIVRKLVDGENYREGLGYSFNIFDSNEGVGVMEEWDKRYRANHYDEVETNDVKTNEILSFVNSEPLKRYWEFTSKTGWFKNTSQFFEFGKKHVLKNIAPYFSHDEFKSFYKIYKQLDEYLQLRLKDINLYAEGDAYWDLRSTLIGDGKHSYTEAIKGDNNNAFVRRMDEDNDYYENFGYFFSYSDIDITVPEEDCKEEWDKIYNNNHK